jgi:hypothetical protein
MKYLIFNLVNKIKREVRILLINQIIIILKISKKNVTRIMKIFSSPCVILKKIICYKILLKNNPREILRLTKIFFNFLIV